MGIPQEFYDDMEQELVSANLTEPKDLNDLAWMGRGIRSLSRQIDMVNEFESKEKERIGAFCQQKKFSLQEKIDKLRIMAMNLLKAQEYGYEGKAKKFELPGIGIFRFSVSRESIDDAAYRNLPTEKQKELQAELPHLFKEKTTVTINPDKALIKEKILEGNEVPGFFLNEPKETFDFKSE